MKVLKVISLVFVALIAAVVVGMTVQSSVHVERTVTIESNKKKIYNQIVDFRKFNVWSPWKEYDPNCEYVYSDKQGDVGATYSWAGNDEVGVGSMKITKMDEDEVVMDLVVTSPWESESVVYYQLEKVDKGIDVTWGYDGEIPLLMGLFMSMDNMLGKEYEKGLTNLKQIVEG